MKKGCLFTEAASPNLYSFCFYVFFTNLRENIELEGNVISLFYLSH
jgi:hypothetical protein